MRLIMNPGHEHTVFPLGRRVRAGEEFEVPDTDAGKWLLLKWARKAPVQPVKEEPPPPIKRGPGRPRKYPVEQAPTYNRRDMRAEDE
jgi:hypothetical protein